MTFAMLAQNLHTILVAALFPWPQAAPFDPEPLFSERPEKRGFFCIQLDLGDLTSLRADNDLATAVPTIGVAHQRSNDVSRAEDRNTENQPKNSVQVAPRLSLQRLERNQYASNFSASDHDIFAKLIKCSRLLRKFD